MNCKPGDMALVIGGPRENLGREVTCLELYSPGIIPTVTPAGAPAFIESDEVFWLIDRNLTYQNWGGETVDVPYAADCYLLPIRPERDEDLEYTQRESDYNAGIIRIPNSPIVLATPRLE